MRKTLDVIKAADWVVDLGPEGGHKGGQLLVCGTPEEVAACEVSHTGRYLHRLLAPQRSKGSKRKPAARKPAKAKRASSKKAKPERKAMPKHKAKPRERRR